MKPGISCIFYLALTLATGAVGSCRSDTKADADTIITVEKRALSRDLYFSGKIKPARTTLVITPVAGIIKEKYFRYGQPVVANQCLIAINSRQLAADYQATLLSYLKAKNAYLSAKERFIGTQALMKYQLIARDLFEAEQRQLASSHLDYLQASYKLQAFTHDTSVMNDSLSLASMKDAARAIREPYQLQRIYAPMAGIALMPPKTGNSEQVEDSNNRWEPGDLVKAGQVLLVIGDFSGLVVDIQVPEIDIHKMKPGLPAVITGAAFAGISLQGSITAVAVQAKSATGSSGGLPVFGVEISVPSLSAEQRNKIYVGMTAKVDIKLQEAPGIIIPIQAVHEKNNQSYVTVIVNHQRVERPVTTGRTSLAEIMIESGLQPGEQLVVHD